MRDEKGKFRKGQSGNPGGRPLKNRALTEILERAGSKTIDKDGRKVARKRVLAELAWALATTGEAKLPGEDGKKLVLDPGDWFGLVKFLYQHIDGPPKSEIDLTSAGERLVSIIEVVKSGDDAE